ncbi:MAG: ubiquinone/menaquinone biosynthesis methylase [Chloroflexi bacterium]|nr:ubiquinone/menaquinone biosynthesis methylase [Chloroflexota bacterium]
MIGRLMTAVAALGAILVRVIRALDRWGGFSSRRGEGAYARCVPWIAGPLHRRIVADTVARFGDQPGAMIVDLGSGPGSLALELAQRLPRAQITGVEPNGRMRAIASLERGDRANVRFVDGTAERIPFPDRSVDLVVSSLSAHHWEDLDAAVREIRRILRPGGAAWIHDIRFATFTGTEIDAVRRRLGLPAGSIRRSVPEGQGRLSLAARIDIDPDPDRAIEVAV